MTNWINEKKQLTKYIEKHGWVLKDDSYTGYTHRKNKTIINIDFQGSVATLFTRNDKGKNNLHEYKKHYTRQEFINFIDRLEA